jgi:16S rRNA (uracil1498-N3)-methyltransferase
MAPRDCKGPRLFVEGLSKRGAIEPNAPLLLSPQDSHYLKDVLRLPVGAFVEIGDPDTGETFKASITENSDAVALSLLESLGTGSAESSITLLCALCKGQKNELITDWATELGCSRIIFWQADRSIVRLKNESDADAKSEKFSKAALAAAQQSRQARPPMVRVATSLAKALDLLTTDTVDLKVCCSLEHDAPPFSDRMQGTRTGASVCVAIGPEGDLTPQELAALSAHGFKPASLGRQILRSELAAVAAIISIKTAS